jgi:outer membrane protein assembly factor BamD (BamD/ComL family)
MASPVAPPAEETTAEAPAIVPDPVQKSDPAVRVAPKSRASSPASTGAAAQSPGAALMLQAMKARKAGDMARAASLLAEYRSKYPDGDLQEEALALSIEAAAARRDGAAQSFASEYLKRFPNGRFREQAERALGSNPR